MEQTDHLWYFLDMDKGSSAYLPEAEVSPVARLVNSGTLQDKRVRVRRERDAFPFHALVALHVGTGRVSEDGGGEVGVRAGDLFLLRAGLEHEYGPTPGTLWDESYVLFAGPVFDALLRADGFRARPLVCRRDDDDLSNRLLSIVELARSRAARPADPVAVSQGVVIGMVLGLLCDLISRPGEWHRTHDEQKWIDEVFEIFSRDSPMSRDLSDVARELGTSYGAFVKRFTRLLGMAPGKARARVVIERAEQMLRAPDLSVTQIADQLGFSDVSYFCRRFKELAGYSPAEFRRLVIGR